VKYFMGLYNITMYTEVDYTEPNPAALCMPPEVNFQSHIKEK
jgi:ABC-type uncharacterized transport system substrate-binding protein